MEMLGWMLLTVCITGIGSSALGAGIASFFDLSSNKLVSMLLSFAAGLMLAIICFDFIPEALELNDSIGHVFLVLLFVAAGAAIVGVLGKVVTLRAQKHTRSCEICSPDSSVDSEEFENLDSGNSHPLHTEDELGDFFDRSPIEQVHSNVDDSLQPKPKEQMKVAGMVMAIAIAMHNLPAGMSIGGSFVSPNGTMVMSGVIISVLLGLHSIPESMSMAIPLLHSGTSKTKAVLAGAAVGTFMVIGALLGFWIGEVGIFWMSMCLAFASGAMLYVLFGEILPESFMLFYSKQPAVAVLIGLGLGIVLVSI